MRPLQVCAPIFLSHRSTAVDWQWVDRRDVWSVIELESRVASRERDFCGPRGGLETRRRRRRRRSTTAENHKRQLLLSLPLIVNKFVNTAAIETRFDASNWARNSFYDESRLACIYAPYFIVLSCFSQNPSTRYGTSLLTRITQRPPSSAHRPNFSVRSSHASRLFSFLWIPFLFDIEFSKCSKRLQSVGSENL